MLTFVCFKKLALYIVCKEMEPEPPETLEPETLEPEPPEPKPYQNFHTEPELHTTDSAPATLI
jgi:hypothetical protein